MLCQPTSYRLSISHVRQELLATVGQTPVAATQAEPVVPVKKSVFADHLICLACGKQFKTLKRHVMSVHQMTPDQDPERFELPRSYPTVAPNYAKARSSLAKKIGTPVWTAGPEEGWQETGLIPADGQTLGCRCWLLQSRQDR